MACINGRLRFSGNVVGAAVLALLAVVWPGVALADDPARIVFSVVVQNERQGEMTNVNAADLALTDDAHAVSGLQVTRPEQTSPAGISILVDSSSPVCVRQAADFVSNGKLGDASVTLYDATQLRLIQAATKDRALLTVALSRLEGGAGEGGTAQADEPAEPVVRKAQELVSQQHMRPWVALCFALASEHGPLPGRKEILFFATEDEQAAGADELRTLGADAARGQTSIYVLQSPVLSAASAKKAKKLIAGKAKTEEQAGEKYASNALRDLAVSTGGLYALGQSSQAATLLRSVAEDLTGSVEVSYPVAADTVDGRFHTVSVQYSREGTHVRAPRGYIAVPQAQALGLMPFEADLYAGLRAAAPDGGFPIDCAILQLGVTGKLVRAEVVAQIPTAALQAQQDDAGVVSTVRYAELAAVMTAEGRFVETLSQAAAVSGTENKSLPDAFTLSRGLSLEPGKYKLQVAARDENSGQIASKSLAFEIKPSDVKNALGDPVVVRGAEQSSSGGKDPLDYGTARIVPFASSRVALGSGAQMPVLLTVSAPAAQAVSQLQLEITQGSASIATIPLLGSFDQAGNYRALVFLEQQSLPPGQYTLIAHAISGESSLERRSEIEILPPDAMRSYQAGMPQSVPLTPVLNIDEPALLTGKADPAKAPDVNTILQRAREKAIAYKQGLPNFTCVVNTQQFVAKAEAKPDWKVKGDMSEVLRYASGSEHYSTIEVNGERTSTEHAKLPGLKMDGEFGELLATVFGPEAKAQFKYKGQARMGGVEVYVLEYSVERGHSNYALATTDGGSRVVCSFHGLVYIDTNSYITRSVSILANDIPKQAQYSESALSVSYDFLTVNGQQFLLPKRAWVAVRVGAKKLMKDEIQFRDYHRFQASTKITF